MLASIDKRFDQFHAENPHVYQELVGLARKAKQRGYQRIGIELLFAQLRWSRMMRTRADEYGFKLNDHFTSRYARKIMDENADLAGIFNTRKLKAS